MRRKNLLCLLLLVFWVSACSVLTGKSAEQRKINAHTVVVKIAPDIGIGIGNLVSEEEFCDLTGCYQQLFFESNLSEAVMEMKLRSSKTFTWVTGSAMLETSTATFIDTSAKRIAHVPGKPQVSMPNREWFVTEPVAIDSKKYIIRVGMYLVSSIPGSYIVDKKPLTSNIVRIFIGT